MKLTELNNLESLTNFLKSQDYNSILAKDKINKFCHDYNLKGDTFYSDKYGYFELAVYETNLAGLFCRYLFENNDEFPTLDVWLGFGQDYTIHHYCFESDEGNYFDYHDHEIMFLAVSERLLLQHYLTEIQKLVTLIDVKLVMGSILGYSNFKAYVYSELNLNTNADILIYDYLNDEYIDFNICLEGEMMFFSPSILFLNDTNTYTSETKGIKLRHFNNELLIDKVNDRIAIEGFNEIYFNTLNEILNKDDDWR